MFIHVEQTYQIGGILPQASNVRERYWRAIVSCLYNAHILITAMAFPLRLFVVAK